MAIKNFYNLLVLLVVLTSCKKNETQIFTIQGEAQGSTYSIKFVATEENVTKNQIDSLLTAFDLSLSTYRTDSKISKINAGDTSVIVDDFFTETFHLSKQICKETEGLFDPTIGVLVNAYGFGPNRQHKNLNQTQIDSLLNYVGFDKINSLPYFKHNLPTIEVPIQRMINELLATLRKQKWKGNAFRVEANLIGA